MAPEQAAGSGTSRATDVYALGAILYETLCGRPVMGAGLSGRGDMVEYLRSKEPLPARPAHALVEGELPVTIREIIAAALSRDPNERPDGARGLQQALERALAETEPEQTPSGLVRLRNALGGLFKKKSRAGGRFSRS